MAGQPSKDRGGTHGAQQYLSLAVILALTACRSTPAPSTSGAVPQRIRDSIEQVLATRIESERVAGLSYRAARAPIPLTAPAIVLIAPYADAASSPDSLTAEARASASRLRELVDAAHVTIFERSGELLRFESEPGRVQAPPPTTGADAGYLLILPGVPPQFHRGFESPDTIAHRMRDWMEAHGERPSRTWTSRPRA